ARIHLNRLDDLGLRRQLGGDLALGAPEEKRAHPASKQPAALGIAFLLDGRAPATGKALAVAEKAGRQEREQRPQLAEMIFERRAGQAQAMACFDLTHSPGGRGIRILDRLRLIENKHVPGLGMQYLMIAGKKRI